MRDLDTARAAVDAGADALGFVFAEESPRHIEPREAWPIVGALAPFVSTIGLFVDATIDGYADVEEICPTDYGQLHGSESEAVVRACGPRIIKAVRFALATIEAELRRWSAVEEVDAILVDGSAGGKGRTLDWKALAAVKSAATKPLFLAGGLTPENVAEAVRVVRPYAVDVSSGVESAVGVKDAGKIRAFCEAVRAADGE